MSLTDIVLNNSKNIKHKEFKQYYSIYMKSNWQIYGDKSE